MLAAAIHWNVDPVLFHIGGFSLRYYSLGFLVAFSVGYYLLGRMFKREGVSDRYLDAIVVAMFLAVLIGARLGHCLFYEPDYFLTSEHWVEIFWPFQNGQFKGYAGLASHGAAFAILIAFWVLWKRFRLNPWWIVDRVVIIIALGGAFIRLGNLFNSEIYGVETTLPWGFIFERNGETVPKHPTALYEAFSYLAIFAVSYTYYIRTNGKFRSCAVFGWWLVALFSARFLIEFVKNDQVDFEANMLLNMGQLLSLPFIVGGLVIAYLSKKEVFPQGPFPWGENKPKKK